MVHVERLEHMVLLRDTSSMVHYATCVRIARHCLFLFGGGAFTNTKARGEQNVNLSLGRAGPMLAI